MTIFLSSVSSVIIMVLATEGKKQCKRDLPPNIDSKMHTSPKSQKNVLVYISFCLFLSQGLSTYKELCSLASDLSQPDLVYKFMNLANHHAMWNSRKVSCCIVSFLNFCWRLSPGPHTQQASALVLNSILPDFLRDKLGTLAMSCQLMSVSESQTPIVAIITANAGIRSVLFKDKFEKDYFLAFLCLICQYLLWQSFISYFLLLLGCCFWF